MMREREREIHSLKINDALHTISELQEKFKIHNKQ